MYVERTRGGEGVVIGGKPYRSVHVAETRFSMAGRATKNPFKKLFCWAVLLELRAMS